MTPGAAALLALTLAAQALDNPTHYDLGGAPPAKDPSSRIVREGDRVFYEGRDVGEVLRGLDEELAKLESEELKALAMTAADPKRDAVLSKLGDRKAGLAAQKAKYEAFLRGAPDPPAGERASAGDSGASRPGAMSAPAPGLPSARASAPSRRSDAGTSGGRMVGFGGPAPGVPSSAPALDREGMNRAMGRASAIGAAFKTGGLEEAAAMGAGSGAGAPSRGGGAAGGPSGPPASSLSLAARGAFSGAAARLGLRVEPGPDGAPAVFRADGSPASAAEAAALAASLERTPRALLKRPDFFAVLPPARFAGIKSAVAQSPAAPPLRHVGLDDAGRDIVWTESCDRLSGGCNPAAQSMSYDDGDFISPEDLDAIWDELLELGLAEEEEEADRRKAALERVRQKLGRKALGQLSTGELAAAVAGELRAPSGAAAASYGIAAERGGREPVKFSEPGRKADAGRPPSPDRAWPTRPKSRAFIWGVFLAAASGFFILAWCRRERRGDRSVS